ncbi:hypothetical protein [Spirosoma fluviale]|uniref:Uncharacterized protein n=1 Tax=Spirosoma fluviale TaxID=1597977 RepID=A0A286F4D9_9BACT|nr:hypothetical protein [Spirosoma fluviale]SOD78097.1 hypothetical protein SAMN06269250_0290 [Spirosoma fluviale]
MKTKWLFPHRFRLIGWLIFVPFTALGVANLYADFNLFARLISKEFGAPVMKSTDVVSYSFGFMDNFTDEIAAIGVIVGLLFIAFSREKIEDEMISQLRLEALQWSVYANYIILTIAILTVYEGAFLDVMMYNMFTVLLVFIIRFRWLIHRNNTNLLAL